MANERVTLYGFTYCGLTISEIMAKLIHYYVEGYSPCAGRARIGRLWHAFFRENLKITYRG